MWKIQLNTVGKHYYCFDPLPKITPSDFQMLIKAAFSYERLKWNLKCRAFSLLHVLWIFLVFANIKQSVIFVSAFLIIPLKKMKNSSNTEASTTHSIRFKVISSSTFRKSVPGQCDVWSYSFLWYKKTGSTSSHAWFSSEIPLGACLLCFRVFCCYNARP